MNTCTVDVELPFHLANLARSPRVVRLTLPRGSTTAMLLDELERRYPVLCGTVREYGTLARRPYLRFFCCQQDISQEPADASLPEPVLAGAEPFIILGSVAGG